MLREQTNISKGKISVKVNNNDTRTTTIGIVLVFLVDFEK